MKTFLKKSFPPLFKTGEGMIFSTLIFQKAIPDIQGFLSRYFRIHLKYGPFLLPF
jgi:hypothetical protein